MNTATKGQDGYAKNAGLTAFLFVITLMSALTPPAKAVVVTQSVLPEFCNKAPQLVDSKIK